MARVFEMDLSRLGAVSAELEEALRAERATEKEIRQTLLLVEEIAVKFSMCMPDALITVTVGRRLGTLSVRLSAEGVEHNPIIETNDWSAGSEDYYRTLILRAHKDLLSFQRANGCNIVTIRVHTEEKKYVRYSLIALLSGLALGLIFHYAVNDNGMQWMDAHVFPVIQTIFMNAMFIMVVPAVFCSVVNSITGLSSLSDTGRMSGRIMGLYSLTTVLAIVVSFLIAIPLFSATVPAVPELGAAGENTLVNLSVSEMITGIVPQSLIAPLESGNIAQTLLLAAITGIAMGILGEKVASLRRLVAALDALFQTIISLIALLVPVLTFISILSLVSHFGFAPLPIIAVLILAELLGCIVMFGIYNLMLRVFGKIQSGPYARKTIKFFSKTNLQASSGEYLPKVVGLCTEQLGVSERVASFSGALGASVNMDGSAIHMVVCSVLMARLFGLEFSGQMLVLIGAAVFILSGGAAAVHNAGMLSVSSLAVLLGVPSTVIVPLFGVDQILDLTRTASNAVGDVSVCVIVANQENELDKDVYIS